MLSPATSGNRCFRARAGTLEGMAKLRSPDLIVAQPEDAERLASLSRAAKLSYRDWARPGWEPPSFAAERARWERRLVDPAGRTLVASDSGAALGTVHVTDARTRRGEGKAIEGRAHLSGLFVLPASWGEGIGTALLEAALAAMRGRGRREAQLFTAAANRRSRTFYVRRGWRASATTTDRHDGLRLTRYERSLVG
jgi:GNAT superfamily N-acetyltransferase